MLDCVRKFFLADQTLIGKHTPGWSFALCQYPHLNLIDWESWKRHIETQKFAFDEYGCEVCSAELFLIIESSMRGKRRMSQVKDGPCDLFPTDMIFILN